MSLYNLSVNLDIKNYNHKYLAVLDNNCSLCFFDKIKIDINNIFEEFCSISLKNYEEVIYEFLFYCKNYLHELIILNKISMFDVKLYIDYFNIGSFKIFLKILPKRFREFEEIEFDYQFTIKSDESLSYRLNKIIKNSNEQLNKLL